jgi:hypothetical protein
MDISHIRYTKLLEKFVFVFRTEAFLNIDFYSCIMVKIS